MHSDSTARRAHETTISESATTRRTCRSRRWTAVLGGVLIGALALAGCAEGTVQDAERGRAEDQQRESIVGDAQATRSAELVGGAPSTPASTPSMDELELEDG